MPWSYNALNPNATPLDEARSLALDVRQEEWSPEDEIVTYWLTRYAGRVLRVALEIARFKQAKHKETQPQSRTAVGMTSSKVVGPFDELVARLQSQVDAGTRGGIATFGISRSDVREVESDSDFCPPFAGVGRNRNT